MALYGELGPVLGPVWGTPCASASRLMSCSGRFSFVADRWAVLRCLTGKCVRYIQSGTSVVVSRYGCRATEVEAFEG